MNPLRSTRRSLTVAIALVAAARLAEAAVRAGPRTGWTDATHLAALAVQGLGTIVVLALLADWTRKATRSLATVGPKPEGVWGRALLGYLFPVVGAFLLFDLAGRLQDASAAGREPRAERPGFLASLGPWAVAYVAFDAARLVDRSGHEVPGVVLPVLLGAFALLALPGLHRFLKTVEEDLDAAAARTPPADPRDSQATAIPDEP